MHVTHVSLNTNWPRLRRTVSPINRPHEFSSATYSRMCLIKYASITYTIHKRGQSQWCMQVTHLPLTTKWPRLRRKASPINGPHGLTKWMHLINYSSTPYTPGRERGWSQWSMHVTHLPLNTNWPCLRRKALLINGPHGFCVATYSGIHLIHYSLIPYTQGGWSQWHMHVTHVSLNTNWPCLRRTVSPINGPHG